MFVGRECYRYTYVLSRLLDKQHAGAKVSRKWLQPFLKVYVFLFGVPDVSFQLRARYLRGIIKPIKFKRALDAGCGIGVNTSYIARKNPQATVDAFDLSQDLVNAAKLIANGQNLKNVNVFRQDITKFSETDRYDLIYCIDVIEHIPDDTAVISNFFKAMKRDGTLVLSTPHKRHTMRRIKGLKYESSEHVRAGYTETELLDLLKQHGFDIKSVRHIWGFFGEYCEELYLWSMMHMPAALAALSFPFLSLVSSLDMLFENKSGYGLMVIAKKS